MSDAHPVSAAPLLTVGIPTWNRASYLAQNLRQLRSEMSPLAPGLVEVVVSDNCSPDSTPEVVQSAVKSGLPIRYVRNEKNLGWALNFAQAFDLARGKYVLLMGDDDLFVDGALKLLTDHLGRRNYGVACLRPYGFDNDFRLEYPGAHGRARIFHNPNRFLIAISRHFTLTSACVVNKSLLTNVDSRQFSTTDLAAFHLVLRAALAAEVNLYISRYLIASKRQNSFSYEFTDVHVNQMWRIIDAHVQWGLQPETVRLIERRRMLSYYPFYLFDLRVSGRGDLRVALDNFAKRFHDRWLFKYWLAPTIVMPKPLGIMWGCVTTFIGRVIDGQLRRGFKFAWNRFTRSLRRRQPAVEQKLL